MWIWIQTYPGLKEEILSGNVVDGRGLLFAIESNVAHEIFEFQAVFVPTDHVGD